jgi:hypothetical protein
LIPPFRYAVVVAEAVSVTRSEVYLAWWYQYNYSHSVSYIATHDLQTLKMKSITAPHHVAVIDLVFDDKLGKLFGMVDPHYNTIFTLGNIVEINPSPIGNSSFITRTIYLPDNVDSLYTYFYHAKESKYYIEALLDSKTCKYIIFDSNSGSFSYKPLPCSKENTQVLYNVGGWSELLGGPLGFSTPEFGPRGGSGHRTEIMHSVNLQKGTKTPFANLSKVKGLNDLYSPSCVIVPVSDSTEAFWIANDPDHEFPRNQTTVAIIGYDSSGKPSGPPKLITIPWRYTAFLNYVPG